MIDKELVRGIAESAIENKAMFLVDIQVNPGNAIVIEIDSDESIGIDDCIVLSKTIEAQLDRDVEDFELEVGSSGLTSPFKLPRQYVKNIGNEVEVLTRKGEKMTGVLKSADDEGFVVIITKLEKPEGAKRKIAVDYDFPFKYDEVKYTKYQIRFK